MKQIASALVKAQKAFGPALKSSTNPHFRNKYADLSACVEAVIDGLNNNGIFLMQLTDEHPDGIKIQTVFIHESGEQMSSGWLFVPAAKADPQGFGSALTYARRYSLMAACGIAPEDDDGNAGSKPVPAKPAAPVPVPKVVQPPVVEAPAVVAPPVAQVVEEKKAVALSPKLEGKEGEWQLKVSAQPDTDLKSWIQVIFDATKFVLSTASNVNDVMSIFRSNRIVFDRLQIESKESYDELMGIFKQYREKLNVK